MKKHKDIFYTLLGIGVVASFIVITHRSQQPEPMKLDFAGQPQSEEHIFVSDILADTEAVAAAEDARIDQASSSGSVESVPLPVAGAPLPVAWDSQSAPNLAESELSPSLQRSLAASASLRTEAYINPSSEFNLGRVEDIRAIRKNRHATE